MGKKASRVAIGGERKMSIVGILIWAFCVLYAGFLIIGAIMIGSPGFWVQRTKGRHRR